ncbi:NADPH:quinone reductase [Flexibacter flexilis DSM 6793]|uniref:NADPH:quinone reductase n=1 Tax=Flexibacter flexilis DSM 6793 TaxID=927664 RepID=A0A1I1MBZ7_9BACT|nr:NADP-dependent oxidoreductase [Flexibacter flexilis]SFC82362.1 NADPH:quinone reductase [Flexibacter flexilis DSM 6793]
MKAYTISRYSKTAKLQCSELPQPTVGEHDVLIEVHAAAVNLLDAKIKSGEFKLLLPYKFPLVLGHDVAGVIVKIGASVKNFKIGDAVYARPADFRIGTFAEFIVVNEADVAPKPHNISMEEAASLPLVALTAWQALVELANVQQGQKVFIQAGSGGVGTIAIQLAKYLGATVATTASTQNFEWLRKLGADVLIDYRTQDFVQILKDYDVALNSQDSETLQKSLSVLKKGGKLVSISGPPTPAFARQRGATWIVKMIIWLISRSVCQKAKAGNIDYQFLFMKASGSQLREIKALIEAGVIRPVIDKVFSFEQTNEALSYVESGRSKGKVVIKLK